MKRLVVILVILTFVGAACGGGTTVSVGDDSPTASSGSDGSDNESGDDQSDSGASEGGDQDDGGAAFAGGSFCDLAEERERQEDDFNAMNFSDPDAIESLFNESKELIETAVDIAPGELSGDMMTIQADFMATYELLDAAGWDMLAVANDAPPDTTGFDEADQNVDDWIRDNCGFDPDANEDDGLTDEQLGDLIDDSDSGDELGRDALIQFGFTDDQATCLSESISFGEFAGLAEGDVPGDVLDRFASCGVSLEDLAQFGGADPGGLNEGLEDLGDLPPGATDVFVQEMINQGFTEDEATCLAEGLFTNSETAGDIFGALEGCDIPLSRMAEIGELGG